MQGRAGSEIREAAGSCIQEYLYVKDMFLGYDIITITEETQE